MSKFVDIQIKYSSYDAAASTNDPADADKMLLRVQESASSQVFRLQKSVPNSTVDAVIALPGSPTDYVLISSDQNISVKLNGSSDSQALNVKSAGTKCPVLYQRGALSGLLLSNASGAIANVDIILVKN